MVGAVALGDSRETKKVTSADAISVSQVNILKTLLLLLFRGEL